MLRSFADRGRQLSQDKSPINVLFISEIIFFYFCKSTFKYLFTFVSNCLMEMITEHDNYEHLAWSVGVRLRGNLDSIHTWAEQFGLGNDFKKVSAKLSEETSFRDLNVSYLI